MPFNAVKAIWAFSTAVRVELYFAIAAAKGRESVSIPAVFKAAITAVISVSSGLIPCTAVNASSDPAALAA